MLNTVSSLVDSPWVFALVALSVLLDVFLPVLPSGVLLASINSNDPGRIAAMLRRALARWEKLPRRDRLLAKALPT